MPNRSLPKIILDTDPGGDDTFALLWLLTFVQRGLAELVAVTSADGNVAARNTFTNSSQLLAIAGFPGIEVGRGVLMQSSSEDASHIHGTDGMGGLSGSLPAAVHDYETARFSDEIIIEKLNANPGEITIVAIGPLTNLAAAETKRPGVLSKAKEIVIMGGAFYYRGNVTPHAEFNVWFNPEAAAIVFNSCTNLVVMSLDITHRLIFTRDMAQTLRQTYPDHPITLFLVQLSEFMISTALSYRETTNIPGFLVHDAATISYLFYPDLFSFKRANVYIETKGEWTRGQTLIDDRPRPKFGSNSWVALQVDEQQFFAHLLKDLQDWTAG